MADERVCAGCGEPLPATSRPDRRHHNQNCRHRALRRRQREERQAAAPPPSPIEARLEAALAEALAEPRLLAIVARAAQQQPQGWRAAAWLLERSYPERWSAR